MKRDNVWEFLVGRPLKSAEGATEEIGTSEGLAALSLDALSSVAYGPEAIGLVLVTAGLSAMRYLLPITLAIVGLLAILVMSYSQVIEAYPNGGGAYAVSRENLGVFGSQVAGAALTVDYILTVAISIAAGIGALTSAFTVLLPYTLPLCLGLLAVITYLNLRGVGESARAFLLPTMMFIVGLLALLAWGFLHPAHAVSAHPLPPAPAVPLFFILKAFAAGCTALTGVEAIANGVPLFKKPRVLRAKRTEWLLGSVLGVMLLGLAVLTVRFGVAPGGNTTMLSKVMVDAVGHGWFYYVVALSITAVLGLAANTSFGGLPLLASIMARDHYAPHIFAVRGDRLVFNSGIWVLSAAAALLLIAVNGNTQALIPLFAIGVFTGFTLSQTGMVVRWFRTRPPHWQGKAALNLLGALATGVATLLFVITKFAEGAFVVVIAIPLLILGFQAVHRYYMKVGSRLRIAEIPGPVVPRPRPLVIVPITPTLSALTQRGLAQALSLSDEVIAVTVIFEPDGPDDPTPQGFQKAWDAWNPGVRLVILPSQYHSVVRPLIRFINTVERRRDQRVMVLIPEIVADGVGAKVLHNRVGSILEKALRQRTDVVVGMVPMHVTPDRPLPSAPEPSPSPHSQV